MVSFKYHETGKHVGYADLVCCGVALELKKVRAMPIGRLQQFHGASIEVEVEVQGKLRSLHGKGSYQVDDPELGPVLKILVSDPAGDFEFFVAESTWKGTFEPSDLPGCDCRVSFTAGRVV